MKRTSLTETLRRTLARASIAFAMLIAIAGLGAAESVQLGADNNDPSTRSAESHTKMLGDKPHTRFYTRKFDLSGLPRYAPAKQLTGVVRVAGSNYIHDSFIEQGWRDGFRQYQPGIELKFFLPTEAIAFAALEFNGADIVLDHRGLFYDFLGFEREFGYDPLTLCALTGAYNVTGWNSTRAIVVNKENPLKGISMAQLDGVFGSERAGGWDKATWHPDWARSRDKDIRFWGRLGLTGAWADKEIKTYGFSCRYSAAVGFSDDVMKGSDKWNPNYQGYANYRKPGGTWYIEGEQIADHIAEDRYGIGFLLWQDGYANRTRMVPVAPGDSASYVTPSWDTLFNSTYPLHSEFYWYLNVKPGTRIAPPAREFLEYVISQQGEEVLENDGKYLPINAQFARENERILAEYEK